MLLPLESYDSCMDSVETPKTCVLHRRGLNTKINIKVVVQQIRYIANFLKNTTKKVPVNDIELLL